jgi:hypothetical protein
MKIQLKIVLISALVLSLAYSGCYYDSEEGLYYENCDTMNVTYTKSVASIFAGYCNSCHEGTNSSGIVTNNYNSVLIDTVRISGSINHKQGFIPMPNGGGSLSECDLKKFNIWARKGYPQ